MVENSKHLAETDHGGRCEGAEDDQGQGQKAFSWDEGSSDPIVDIQSAIDEIKASTGLTRAPISAEFSKFACKPLWAAPNEMMEKWRTWVAAWNASKLYAIKEYLDARGGCMDAGYGLLRRRDKRFRDALVEIAQYGNATGGAPFCPWAAEIARKALENKEPSDLPEPVAYFSMEPFTETMAYNFAGLLYEGAMDIHPPVPDRLERTDAAYVKHCAEVREYKAALLEMRESVLLHIQRHQNKKEPPNTGDEETKEAPILDAG